MSGSPPEPSVPARRISDRSPARHHPPAPFDGPGPVARAARERLARMRDGREPFDVVEASLLVAQEEYPDLDVLRVYATLDGLGVEAARRVAPHRNPFARIDALRTFLFDDLGFRGNTRNYDDPRNSFLNDVLERKLGIPLTLSLVFLEAGRRAGLDVRGVALPGHFVARVDDGGRRILVDPFHGGQVITEEDCRDLVIRTTGRPSMYRRSYLDGASPVTMVARLLLNLKRIYLARGDYANALAAIERLLILSPDDAREIRDRGLLLAHLGRANAAVTDLETYLDLAPGAPDAESIRGRLSWLLRKMSGAH